MEFELNPERFNYMLDLFGLTKDEFITRLNEGRKREVLNLNRLNLILQKKEKITYSVLKKIDEIFKQGLTWYISQRELPRRQKSSIFFRKDSFNTSLNLESRKLVSSYEDLKFEIQVLCKQINFKPKRIIKEYKLSDNPETVGKEIRENFDDIQEDLIKKSIIKNSGTDRDYLESLIRVFEHFNIFVFEHVDRNKKPDKLIIFNGFFMLPNIIVIKRQQRYLRREIFTLLHEFAHYLLNIEEIDENVETNDFESQNTVEQWCSTFAYSFLIKDHEKEFSLLKSASSENNFFNKEIKDLRDKTRLSEFALYTRLRIENRISKSDYYKIKNEIIKNIQEKEQEEKIKLDEERLLAEKQGKKMFVSMPKEIKSNLFEEIVKINYFAGNITETELREHLKIKANKLTEEVVY